MENLKLITNNTVTCEYELSNFDITAGKFSPYYGTISWYQNRIDARRLKKACQQIVDSVPILGGRLVKKLFSPIKVVCQAKKHGIGFIEVDLGKQEINLDNLLEAKTYLKNVFNIPEKSVDAINTDAPLIYLILNYNQTYSGITLLVNHLIVGGGTYFQFLEHLAKAYGDPDYVSKSEPLWTVNFNKIDNFLNARLKERSWNEKLLSSTFIFAYLLRSLFTNKSDWSCIKCILTKENLDLIKQKIQKMYDGETVYSRNDALLEFLSVTPIKRFIIVINLRYRKFDIPENYLGNAETIVSGLTQPENNYMLKHSDVRKTINELRGLYSFLPVFNSEFLIINSWIKLQSLPSFGENDIVLQKNFEFDDKPFDLSSFPCRNALLYRLTKNKYLLMYFNLKNVVSQIENKLRDIGVEDIVIETY